LQKIFLPKFTGKISSELERKLLLEAKAIDYQLSLEANEIAANSIHFPGEGISEVPARDFYDVKKCVSKDTSFYAPREILSNNKFREGDSKKN